jgi:hypothetical protein
MTRSPAGSDSAWPVSFTGSIVRGLVTSCVARDWADSFSGRKRVPLQQAVLVSCNEFRLTRRNPSLEFWVRYLGQKVRTRPLFF